MNNYTSRKAEEINGKIIQSASCFVSHGYSDAELLAVVTEFFWES